MKQTQKGFKTLSWNTQTYTPSKIVCVGRNYVEHIHELNNPIPQELVLFIKPNSSLSSELIRPEQRCRYETEIVFLIQDGMYAAVGIGLDLTLIDVQQRLKKNSLPWEKSKAFDHSAVLSPLVALPSSIEGLHLQMMYDGVLRQEGGVHHMIHSPASILKETQTHFSLCDGDLIMTGTPKGVGELTESAEICVRLWSDTELLLEHTWSIH